MSPFVSRLSASIADFDTETLENALQISLDRNDRDYVEAIVTVLAERR